MYDDSSQDCYNRSDNMKTLLQCLCGQTYINTPGSAIWENKDGCAELYRCSTTLYMFHYQLMLFDLIFIKKVVIVLMERILFTDYIHWESSSR